MIAGRLANKNRNGYGKLSTHWRTGCLGKTSSTSNAALSANCLSTAAGAEAPSLATKCDQVLSMTAAALNS